MTHSTRTKKTIDVDEDALARFEEIYPMRGAFTWFVNEALQNFVSLHEIQPSDNVSEAVTTALSSKE